MRTRGPGFHVGLPVSDPRFRDMLNEMWELSHRPITGPGVTDSPIGVVIAPPRSSPQLPSGLVQAGSHITVTEDIVSQWTVAHNTPATADASKNADYLSGLSSSGTQSSTGTTITLTAAKNTLQFDEFGHKAGSVAGTDDEVTFTVPDDLGDLADVAGTAGDGYLLRYNGTATQWEPVMTGTQSVVTGWRVNGTDVEIKTRNIEVIAAGDESDWTVAHAGTTCAS